VEVRLLSPRLLEDADAAARFERGAEALIAAPHACLLNILDTGTDGSRPYLVTESFQGSPLSEVLRQRRLTIPETIGVTKGICRGLAHAHQRGVFHHHLAPQSVRVSPDLSTVKLTDFGFSRAEALGLTGTLSTGAITLGAFHYLAPEQVENRPDAPADQRADLYAAGVIFQEMLTGLPPGSKFVLPSQANAELTPDTDVIVLKCLARNPAERYRSALELLADLGKLEEALRVRLLSEIRGITQSPKSKRGVLIAVIVALLLALAVAGFLLSR
jgi:serine/threonine-protein kinase